MALRPIFDLELCGEAGHENSIRLFALFAFTFLLFRPALLFAGRTSPYEVIKRQRTRYRLARPNSMFI